MGFKDNAKGVEVLNAAARTASANSSGIDAWGFNRARGAVFVLSIGAVSGTTPTLNVKIQESDDNSAWTDISGAAFAQKTAAGSEEIGVKFNKRYFRAVATVGGTTPSFTFSVTAVLGDALDTPL